jgi:hypothetical protein
MKLDPNMQIDRLLRRHARRGPEQSADVASTDASELGSSGSSAHLDADELNAFAENALPAAARMRYSAHLADCDRCRKLATDLALASGVLNELEKAAGPRTASDKREWRGWIAALFAPAVLRYAASALVLVGVATIGFLVFRSGEPLKFKTGTGSTETSPVAVNNEPSSQPNTQAERSSDYNAPPHSGSGETRQSNANSTDRYAEEESSQQQEMKNAPKPTPPPAVGSTSGLTKEETARQPVDELAGEPAPPAVARSLPAAAPPSRDEKQKTRSNNMVLDADEAKRADDAAGNRAQRGSETGDKDGRLAQDKAANAPDNERLSAKSRKRQRRSEPGPQTDVAGAASVTSSGEDRNKKESDEARRVGGRQFVRRGGAWVDTAYKSQATTNVRRGSEQYRALVADESGLRTIAEQLDGEVIVVWKSRAYRIR